MAEIFVAMPVYRGAETVPEAVRALRRQTFQDFRCVVSVDPADDDDSAATVRQAVGGDARFEIVEQPVRLGWPGNLNWLVRRCDLPYFLYWQQDDFASTRYLEVLRDALLTRPDAAIAYTDVQWFGDRLDRDSLMTVDGPPLARVLQTLEDMSYIPQRGLIRSTMLPRDGIVDRDGRRGRLEFGFLARAAAAGSFVRCDGALYFKRGEQGTAGGAARGLPGPERRVEWATVGAEMLEAARGCTGEDLDGPLLALVVDRLFAVRAGRGFWVETGQSAEAAQDVVLRVAAAAGIDLADPRWFAAGPTTGLERPVSPLVVAALQAERARRDRLAGGGAALADRLGFGFNPPEDWGAWTADPLATLELGGPTVWPGGTVRIRGHVAWPSRVAATSGAAQPSWVTVDRPWETVELSVETPPGAHRIELHAPDARTPDGPDVRCLGLAVEDVRLHIPPSCDPAMMRG